MFEHARIKLTLWYLAIIMLVSGFFSLIVYRGFTKEIGRGFRMQAMHGVSATRIVIQDRSGLQRILPFVIYPDELAPDEFIEIINLAKHRFALQLLIINGGILLLAGTLGYFLAGKTLHPIEVMVTEQKRFTADASHELRTPLTSMKSEIEVTLRSKGLRTQDLKNLLKSNLQEIDKMKYFSDNLLSLSRYESNHQDLQMERVDLVDSARQAIERNMPQAKEKKIKILEDLSEVVVKGNPQSLVELISILVNNAIKYSQPSKSISLSLSRRPGGPIARRESAVIKISDQGIGIAKKDIPHVFDRFFRTDSSRSKKEVDGYGLGLSIAKSIVDVHKGEIKVKSEIGKGSTFTVILPA